MKHVSVIALCLAVVLSIASLAASAQSIPTWQPNTAYATGALVAFQGAEYKCIQAHTSQAGWEPPNVPALWGLVSGTPSPTPTPNPTPTPTPKPSPTPTPTPTPKPSPSPTPVPSPTPSGTIPTWTPGVAFHVGDLVIFSGQEFKCIQPHTSQVGWEPPNVPALWSLVGPAPSGSPTPTPSPTPKPSPTPTPQPTPPPGNLPKHLLTGYWQDFNNGAKCLRISDVPATYDIIAVAFANATATPGAVDFSIDSGLSACLAGGYTAAQFTSDIATVHGRGQKVIISVGGQNGAISVSDSTSATNFANSVASLMTAFGFDGVDIDLENGVNPTAMSAALHQLSSMKPGLIITLAPQTIDMQSTGGAYFQLALNIQSILTIVNMQYYNSGTMLGCDGTVYAQGTEDFETALACIQLQNGLRPDQVGLGLPAQTSAAGGGVVAPSVVVAALNCLAKGTNCSTLVPPLTWPGIRGAMTWSINWDASNGFNFANTVKSGLGFLP